MATTVILSFPGGATVFVQAFSNAALDQSVTIVPPSSQGDAAVFTGSGEYNLEQSLTTQGFLAINAGGQPSFVVPDGGGEYKISVTADGNASEVMGAVSSLITPANGQILIGWVSSEDSTDEDWNDSVVLFTTYLPASGSLRTAATPRGKRV